MIHQTTRTTTATSIQLQQHNSIMAATIDVIASTAAATTATINMNSLEQEHQNVNCHSETDKICYFCGSTKHASSDCPMYA